MPRECDAEHENVLCEVDPVGGDKTGNEDYEKPQLHSRHDEQDDVCDPVGVHEHCDAAVSGGTSARRVQTLPAPMGRGKAQLRCGVPGDAARRGRDPMGLQAFVWVGTSFGTSVERGSAPYPNARFARRWGPPAGFSLHPHPMLTGGEGRDRLWLNQPASCRTWTRCSSRRPCCDMGGAENVARPQRTTSSRLKPALQRRTFVTADVTSDASSLRLRERRSNEPSFCTASTHTKA